MAWPWPQVTLHLSVLPQLLPSDLSFLLNAHPCQKENFSMPQVACACEYALGVTG